MQLKVFVFLLHQARVIPNNDKNRTYSVVYLPKVEGLHKVRKNLYGRNIPQTYLKSPNHFDLLAFRAFNYI